ncbi:MAG: dihydroorotate dehydrogenase electron transfer subunit [Proteobacteria bacterium]|nr:dihydroorotate dehydrogenase electron transfer subunit [Pseudomonadota bacterium]
MSQYQEKATVARIEQFANKNFRLTLHCPQIAVSAKPGQFVMIRTATGKDPLLRRPFSIHQTSSGGGIQIYFKVVGRGTEILSQVKKDQEVSVLGPLGRGFRLGLNGPAIIVGGGLGIAPMLFLAKENCRLKRKCSDDLILLGAREKNELEHLLEDFRRLGLRLLTATDDGSLGHHGFVTEIMQSALPPGCTVYTCGPEPMMARVGKICQSQGIPCQVSVESVMACGMGACLGCSRPAKDGTYTHVCLNGPVYDAEELQWTI